MDQTHTSHGLVGPMDEQVEKILLKYVPENIVWCLGLAGYRNPTVIVAIENDFDQKITAIVNTVKLLCGCMEQGDRIRFLGPEFEKISLDKFVLLPGYQEGLKLALSEIRHLSVHYDPNQGTWRLPSEYYGADALSAFQNGLSPGCVTDEGTGTARHGKHVGAWVDEMQRSSKRRKSTNATPRGNRDVMNHSDCEPISAERMDNANRNSAPTSQSQKVVDAASRHMFEASMNDSIIQETGGDQPTAQSNKRRSETSVGADITDMTTSRTVAFSSTDTANNEIIGTPYNGRFDPSNTNNNNNNKNCSVNSGLDNTSNSSFPNIYFKYQARNPHSTLELSFRAVRALSRHAKRYGWPEMVEDRDFSITVYFRKSSDANNANLPDIRNRPEGTPLLSLFGSFVCKMCEKDIALSFSFKELKYPVLSNVFSHLRKQHFGLLTPATMMLPAGNTGVAGGLQCSPAIQYNVHCPNDTSKTSRNGYQFQDGWEYAAAEAWRQATSRAFPMINPGDVNVQPSTDSRLRDQMVGHQSRQLGETTTCNMGSSAVGWSDNVRHHHTESGNYLDSRYTHNRGYGACYERNAMCGNMGFDTSLKTEPLSFVTSSSLTATTSNAGATTTGISATTALADRSLCTSSSVAAGLGRNHYNTAANVLDDTCASPPLTVMQLQFDDKGNRDREDGADQTNDDSAIHEPTVAVEAYNPRRIQQHGEEAASGSRPGVVPSCGSSEESVNHNGDCQPDLSTESTDLDLMAVGSEGYEPMNIDCMSNNDNADDKNNNNREYQDEPPDLAISGGCTFERDSIIINCSAIANEYFGSSTSVGTEASRRVDHHSSSIA